MSDIRLRVYLENTSIPMGFGIFYPMRYINQGEVFQAFYNSGQESIWLDGDFDKELPEINGWVQTIPTISCIRFSQGTVCWALWRPWFPGGC